MLATTPTGSRRMNEVWPARYSVAARPSGTRAAPAKNRNRSTQVRISSIAAPTGLPAFWLSSRPISSAAASSESAILSRIRLRSCGVVFFQVAYACSAALTARSTSSAALPGTLAITWPVAGFSTSMVSPEAASTKEPPMNCW